MTAGRRARGAAPAALLAAALLAGCAASDDAGPAPIVDRIDDAIFATESHYQAPQDYFEISADLDRVSLIVAVPDPDGGGPIAERSSWSSDGGFVEPVVLTSATGATFDTGDLEFDPDDIFDEVRSELPGASILDFAITGAGDGVLYDARVQSENGGVLLVLLGPDGAILGSQDATPALDE